MKSDIVQNTASNCGFYSKYHQCYGNRITSYFSIMLSSYTMESVSSQSTFYPEGLQQTVV